MSQGPGVRVLAYVDEASMTASVRTGDTVARLVSAALAMLQEQLALGLLLALLADPGSGFQTPLIALGQHVVHFAVASVVHALRILHDAFVIAVAVLVQLWKADVDLISLGSTNSKRYFL